jgi:hypothetical protein
MSINNFSTIFLETPRPHLHQRVGSRKVMNPNLVDVQNTKTIRYQLSDEEFNIQLSKQIRGKNNKLCVTNIFLPSSDLSFTANSFPKINLLYLTDKSGRNLSYGCEGTPLSAARIKPVRET